MKTLIQRNRARAALVLAMQTLLTHLLALPAVTQVEHSEHTIQDSEVTTGNNHTLAI